MILKSSGAPVFLLTAVMCTFGHANSQTLASNRLDGYVSTAALAPDARTIAVNLSRSVQNGDGTWKNSEMLEIMNAADMRVVSKLALTSASSITNMPLGSAYAYVSYCDEGKYIVAFDKSTTLYVTDSTSHELLRTINLGLGALITRPTTSQLNEIAISCSAASSRLVVASTGGEFGAGVLQIFDLANGTRAASEKILQPATVLEAISLSTSGDKLAVLLRDERSMFNPLKVANVEILDTSTLSITSRFSTGNAVGSMSFAGPTEIATLPTEKHDSKGRLGIEVWDILSGRKIRTLADKHADVHGQISVAAKTPFVLGYIPDVHKCVLCSGLEGRTDITAQRVSVWNLDSGDQVFRSEAFGPMIPHISPQFVISQDGKTILVFWPFSDVNIKLITVS